MMVIKKLLVVDDEIDFAKFVKDVAEDLDFEVLLTDNPVEFSSLYCNNIDIVVLDLFMPGTDGIELLRYLADNNSHASVIFMSGRNSSVLHSAKELASEQGISVLGTLQKPFRAKELEDVLNKYIKYSPIFAVNNDLASVEELAQAIKEKALFLVYQPQVTISDREVVGVEALVRWKHPTKGMIPPDYFIPMAEENGLIAAITMFTTKTAIRQQGIWRTQGRNMRMSINMSPKILDDLDLPSKIEACVKALGADISKLVIEVTETALTTNLALYMDILARLRMKGFGISIDDFGTGYSSLQQLIRAPFTELKIDRAFIRNIKTDKESYTISKISIMLAHEFGMKAVAEGIETEAEWNILKQLGCDEGQGYWIGRPMPPEEIESWIKSWSAD
ncbi:regulatory protein for cyclic-di-GMP, EAL domain protein [Psychromonas ingrahamii 37]|uniref:Regulatory protein for cyclic-di-GMP, EAL domain protein n=1 Tax=Psychromonas ingrahamii (strain DSM 17664 / CCUG 51855 / 37) TaxID=357804 RepID=A1SWC1_PSYIN|nr:EAL domain-containing response regulator [Psychromonas ingrahamii]ABM03786.1 regulatory protein for cyclic-di-GMP, EAL domain protein [Psychromonas ingrahamii 37]